MAEYYVDYNHASAADAAPPDNGTAWATPWKTLKYAMEYTGLASGDFIYVAHTHDEPVAADTTVTAYTDVNVICRNTSTNAVTTGAKVNNSANTYHYRISGPFNIYLYGIRFMLTSTGTYDYLRLIEGDGQVLIAESCDLYVTNNSSTSVIILGSSGSTYNSWSTYKNCLFRFGATGQSIRCGGGVTELIGCSIDTGGSAPSTLFTETTGGTLYAEACDFSHVGAGTLVGNSGASGTNEFRFANCKIGTGTVMAAAATVLNRSNTTVWLFNCDNGDNHYKFAHYDALGSTVAVTSPALTAGAKYDGTNAVAWNITTTANASFWHPYVSPWIDRYLGDTSTAITPYIECLNDGAAAGEVYDDTEVYGEFSVQDSANTPLGVIYTDRYTISGSTAMPITPGTTGTDQAAGAGYAAWTGGVDTDGSFKCGLGSSVTPNEIGHIRGRIVVGKASVSNLIVNPQVLF